MNDVTSGRPFWMTSSGRPFFDDLISGRPSCMMQPLFGHLVWWHSAWCFTKCGRLLFSNSSATENSRNTCTSTFTLYLEKWRENLGSPLFLLSGSLCHKTNKMTCANSEVLRQSRHSENGGKIKTSTSTLSMQKKAGKSSFTFIVFVM